MGASGVWSSITSEAFMVKPKVTKLGQSLNKIVFESLTVGPHRES